MLKNVRPWRVAQGRDAFPSAVSVDLDWAGRTKPMERDGARKKSGCWGLTSRPESSFMTTEWARTPLYVWWILRYWGIKNVRMLDGGRPVWLFAGTFQDNVSHRVSTESVKLMPDSVRLVPRNQDPGLIQTRSGQAIDLSHNGNSSFANALGLV